MKATDRLTFSRAVEKAIATKQCFFNCKIECNRVVVDCYVMQDIAATLVVNGAGNSYYVAVA